MNWSKCRQSAGVDARSERLQVVHCVRGEHSTSCFSDSLRLQSASMTGVKQARATRCAAEPSLRDGMSVQEASRCRQEQSWCRAGERGDRRIFQGWQPRRARATSEVDKKGTLCRLDLTNQYLSIQTAQTANGQGVNEFLGSYVVSSPFSPRVLARSLLENTFLYVFCEYKLARSAPAVFRRWPTRPFGKLSRRLHTHYTKTRRSHALTCGKQAGTV